MTAETLARKGRLRPSERLLTRLRTMDLPIPDGARIDRTYAGYWQRAAGAWSWSVQPQIGAYAVGSQYPVGELLAAPRLLVVRYRSGEDWHVFAYEAGQPDNPARFAGYLAEPVADPAKVN